MQTGMIKNFGEMGGAKNCTTASHQRAPETLFTSPLNPSRVQARCNTHCGAEGGSRERGQISSVNEEDVIASRGTNLLTWYSCLVT